MIIALSAGHNVYIGNNFDCGAIENGKRESDITKETVKYLIPLLKAQGHIVIDVTPYNERFETKKAHHIKRCRTADNFKADLYLDVHINAGGGTGVECWTYNASSKANTHAAKICNSISKHIGIKNRGVKYNPSYWSLKHCKAPAIIIEGAFIDNKNDMLKLTPKKYAAAIALAFGEVKNLLTEQRVREICKEEINKAFRRPDKNNHWAEKHYENLKAKGLVIHDKRFDDLITRGEVFALLDRIIK